MVLTDKLKALADIIRTRKGVTYKYTIDQMIEEFNNMPQGTDPYEVADKMVTGHGGGLTEYVSDIVQVRDFGFYGIQDLITVSLPHVNRIGDHAFDGCTQLKNLNINPDNNITTIFSSAFDNAGSGYGTNVPGTYELTFPNAVTIATRAFASSAIKSFTAPNITKIEHSSVFRNSKLENVSMDGLNEIRGVDAFYGTKLKEVELPNLRYINTGGDNANTFKDCIEMSRVSLPELIDITGSCAFEGCRSLSEVNLPKLTNALPKYTFKNAMVEGSTLNFPELLFINPSYGTFIGCGATTYIFGKLQKVGKSAFYGSNIKDLTIMSREMAIAEDATILHGTIFNDSSSTETCYLRVRYNLFDAYRNDPNWKAAITNPNIRCIPVNNQPIESIYILPLDHVNLYSKDGGYVTVQLKVDFNEDDLAAPGQRSATYEILEGTDLFDISSDGVLTAKVNTEDYKDRNVTVKVTSTIDQSISNQMSFTTTYMIPHYEVDTHNGQFIVDESASGENVIYKSDAGSYHVDNGCSLATITFSGYTSITVKYRSYAEGTYDYLIVGALDVTDLAKADRDKLTNASRVVGHTKENQSSTTYSSYTFETDDGEHSFMIMYSKDSSQNSNDDRGYFYIEAQ